MYFKMFQAFYSQILKDNLDNQTKNMYLQDLLCNISCWITYNLKFAVARESSEKQKQYIKAFCFFVLIVAKGNFFSQ